MGIRKTALLVFIGGLAGFVAWLFAESMVARLRSMPHSSRSMQASIYGWASPALIGGLIAGSLALVVLWPRSGWVRGITACIVGANCGAILIVGTDAVLDVVWNQTYGDAYWLGQADHPIQMLAWNLAVAFGITYSVTAAVSPVRAKNSIFTIPGWTPRFARYMQQPTWTQIGRALIAALAAGLAAFVLRTALDAPLNHLFQTLATDHIEVHNGKALFSPWHKYSAVRLCDFVGLGTLIGLFLGLVERLGQKAYVRVMLSDHKYRDYPIEAGINHIGSNEWHHIPLLGDPNVAPTHALIEQRGSTFTLADSWSATGTFLNGYAIRQALLKDGDVIVVGRTAMQFLLRPSTSLPVLTPQSIAPEPAVVDKYQLANHRLIDSFGDTHVLRKGTTTLGRDPNSTVCVSDPTVSRAHAQIIANADLATISDLGSRSGTLVNGHVIANGAQLAPGDRIQIGQTEFVYLR